MRTSLAAAKPDAAMSWWMEKVGKAAQEVAQLSLGVDDVEVLGHLCGLPKSIAGSTIALVGDECTTQIGVCSDQSGCAKLAKMMLGMGEDEELDEEGITDAVCELVNVLGGVVKTQVAEQFPQFKLGIPVYLRGEICVSNNVQTSSVEIRIRDVPVHILILKAGGG